MEEAPWLFRPDAQVRERLLQRELAKLAASPLSPAEKQAQASAAAERGLAMIRTAERLSEECRASPPKFLTYNQTLILFEAVELQTGISAELMKTISFGEALGNAYPDRYPRQFIDLEKNKSLAKRATWAKSLIGVDLPLTLGDDRSFGSPTVGIGIFQLTAPITTVKAALKSGQPVQNAGGGSPGSWWKGSTVKFDARRAVVDPYYNLLVGAQLVRHKMNIYGSPQRPGGPLSWISLDPKTPMEWALIGSTVSTYGGYGPGGGATKRLFTRWTDPSSDAYAFVHAKAVL